MQHVSTRQSTRMNLRETSKIISSLRAMESTTSRRQINRQRWLRVIRSPAFKQYVEMLKQREKNLVNKVTGGFTFKKIKTPLTISFDHLHLNLKSTGRPLLQNIYGRFQPFNITALMGSSGAGEIQKISFLFLLLDKMVYPVPICICIYMYCPYQVKLLSSIFYAVKPTTQKLLARYLSITTACPPWYHTVRLWASSLRMTSCMMISQYQRI
jgi:hypothetical protein